MSSRGPTNQQPSAPLHAVRRLLRATAALAAVAGLAAWAYLGWRWALGFTGGALIGMLNIVFLTVLVREVIRIGPRRGGRIAALLALKVPLVYGGLAVLLLWETTPLVAVICGFSLVLLTIVLRAAGRALLESGLLKSAALLLPLLLLGAVGLGGVAARADTAAHPDDHTAAAAHGAAAEAHADHGAGHDSHEAHGAGGHGEHPPELPNLVHLLYKALGGEGGEAPPAWIRLLYRFQDVFYALLVALIIIAVVRWGTRHMEQIPGPVQNVVEFFIEGFRGFILGILGPGGERYVPFLGTLFLYIWFMNLFGLVPLMRSPTSALNTTAALAVCVFLYVQWTGLRRLGPVKYVKHLAGDPQDVVGWCMVPLMLPLHIISELAKPVSLALRLFGNILGEDVLIGVFAGLGIAVLAFIGSPVGVPLHLPFILLALLMSTVQALVFTLLSTIYIMQVLPHDEAEPELEAGGVPAAEPPVAAGGQASAAVGR
jgi:F-type H+-transporting ATPase subunit a